MRKRDDNPKIWSSRQSASFALGLPLTSVVRFQHERSGLRAVFELEQHHLLAEAGKFLRDFVATNDPLALIEFGNRHRLEPSETPEIYMPGNRDRNSLPDLHSS